MLTPALISSHGQRVRTRSTAFWLALSAFVAAKLISLGAVNVSHAYDVDGMQLLDVECGAEQAVHC